MGQQTSYGLTSAEAKNFPLFDHSVQPTSMRKEREIMMIGQILKSFFCAWLTLKLFFLRRFYASLTHMCSKYEFSKLRE